MDVQYFRLETSRNELHCKAIIPSCHLMKVGFRKKAYGSLSKMSDSCFDDLGWTLMATQIEQVWKCHILGHYMSIICFISHRASRPQRFFPVKFNPCLTWRQCDNLEKSCLLFNVFFTRIHNAKTAAYHHLKINSKFETENNNNVKCPLH